MVVGAVVDAAIGWLVQSILGNLFTDKLEAWTRRVGLGDDVKKLKKDMGYVQMVLAAAKGMKIDSEPLIQFLTDLKEQLYDAEDVMDELDYYRLEEQVANGNSGSSTVGDNTATSSMWSSAFRLGKRKRQDFHESEFSQRIKDIAGELRILGEDISNALKIYGSNFAGTSNLSHQDTRLTTSYVQHKVYGRDAEKESILKLLKASAKSNAITVVPIVGIGGVGKTTLAQLVYNDSEVTNQFQIKIWLCVSDNFDVTRLTREILDCVSKQRNTEIGNLNKLQEDLEKHVASSRFLIVLDDVWDDMKQNCWNKLLAPLRRSQKMGNVILLTTRKKSLAEMTRTAELVELHDLNKDDFWKLFKSCAFGDEKYDECPRLRTIGKQIAQELRGNPLAAKTVGSLLRRNVSIESWTNILNNEDWKSLLDSEGIMPALKLSYDYLPDNLQHCFRYCCLFPKDYHFDGEELVRMWISQGFVHGYRTSNKLEDIGKGYLAELVNSGFFQQAEGYGDSSTHIVMHDLMHDLACEVSKSEFAIVDGSESKEFLSTVRHLSIVTGSAFSPDNFERWLLQVTPKLRSLVLIGSFEPSLFNCFKNMLKGAENLRLLQISAAYAQIVPFLSNLVNCTHLRYLKFENTVSGEAPSIALSKFYHLEVLDAGQPTIVHDMSDLVSMRYLLVTKGAESSKTSSSQFTQVQFLNNLVKFGLFQLQNVSREEACGTKLRDKLQLEMLHLSWKNTLTSDKYASDTFSESEDDSLEDDNDHGSYIDSEVQEESSRAMNNPAYERFVDAETDEQSLHRMNDSINNPSSEAFIDAETDSEVFTDAQTELESPPTNDSNINPSGNPADTRDILEDLEPHRNLKQLWVSGYSGATSPAWLGTSVTCLQTLHLEDCIELQVLPSLESFPLLTKLKLRNMSKVTQVSIPPLKELVLIKMPKLERCSCNSTKDLNSSLRVLMIKICDVLNAFPLFNSCEKLRIEHKSWLSNLSKLSIHDCPQLIVSNPLPPSSSACKLSIARVSTLPTMKGSSNGELIIEHGVDGEHELWGLDDKILSFHNLRALTRLVIEDCYNLSFISLEGFKQLICLKSLEMSRCKKFFSSSVLPEQVNEDRATANFNAFPALKDLSISYSTLSGTWLPMMLQHAPILEELHLHRCEISGLLIEGSESCLSNDNSSPRASSPGNPDDASTRSTREGLVHIPSNLISSLKKLTIQYCNALVFLEKKASFCAFNSLEELVISDCPGLISSFGPRLPLFLESLSGQVNKLFPRLERLLIDDYSFLTSLCNHLPSLQRLEFSWDTNARLIEEQDRALQLLTSLQELEFDHCLQLIDLPVRLHSLPSLKRLKIITCKRILRLPEKGLPPSLEELEIWGCSEELASDCRMLATSMLKVKINGDYVN